MLSKLLRKLRPRSVYDVMAAIACFGVLAGGTAYAANTIGSTDIIDGQVNSADVKDQSLTTFDVSTFLGADIVDGTLTDKDVGSASYHDLPVTVGEVPAQSCKYSDLNVATTGDDHIFVTPDYALSSSYLSYTAEKRSTNNAQLKVCNPTTVAIDDATTYFDVLVIKAGP